MAAAVLGPIRLSETEDEHVRALQKIMESGHAALVGPDGNAQPLPNEVHALFLRVLEVLRAGQAISIVPHMQEMTTQEAANLLGMSRQYLVQLIDRGEIQFHRVGTHRRIYLKDLLRFKERRDRERSVALSELTRLSLEAGLYDDPVAAK